MEEAGKGEKLREGGSIILVLRPQKYDLEDLSACSLQQQLTQLFWTKDLHTAESHLKNYMKKML